MQQTKIFLLIPIIICLLAYPACRQNAGNSEDQFISLQKENERVRYESMTAKNQYEFLKGAAFSGVIIALVAGISLGAKARKDAKEEERRENDSSTHLISITVEGGQIQFIAGSQEILDSMLICVQDYDVESQDHPHILPDQENNLCEWQFWNCGNMEILSEEEERLIQLNRDKIEERRKKECEKEESNDQER